MAVREVLKMGHPLLFQRSAPVVNYKPGDLDQLIDDMVDTMNAMNGAGLAAPQIGVLQRIVIFGIRDNPRYPEAEPVPMTVLINPTIQKLSDELEYAWEGCLSVPGMRGKVPRYSTIKYEGIDQYGEPIERVVAGFHSRVVQHECDHLDGILYPLRVKDLRDFGYEEALLANRGDTGIAINPQG